LNFLCIFRRASREAMESLESELIFTKKKLIETKERNDRLQVELRSADAKTEELKVIFEKKEHALRMEISRAESEKASVSSKVSELKEDLIVVKAQEKQTKADLEQKVFEEYKNEARVATLEEDIEALAVSLL
jgi:hypothetical protein